jgi:hypothetical protein
VNERVFGTLYRLRLGALPLPLVVAARWWIYAVEGIVSFVVAALAVGPLVGETSLLPRMLAATPIVALVALTTSSLGMTVAALSLTHQRIELLAGNLVTYATLVLCGIVAPLATLGAPASRLVHLLPLTNGRRGAA